MLAALQFDIIVFLGTNGIRHFAPCFTIKDTPSLFFIDAAPLFKEERNLISFALVANLAYPFFFDRPCSWSGFPADNDPVNVG